MRLTEQQKEKVSKIRELKKTMTTSEIAKELNLPKSTVAYWYNDDKRENKKERDRKWQKKNYDSKTIEQRRKERAENKEYQKDYHKKRYNEDKEFREKQKKASRECQK